MRRAAWPGAGVRVIGLTSVTRIQLGTLFNPGPLDGVASGCFGSREFAIPDSPLPHHTDRPRVALHHHLNLNQTVHVALLRGRSLHADTLVLALTPLLYSCYVVLIAVM